MGTIEGMLKEASKMVTTDLKRNPYLFIVGCPRSGTTLLRRILNAHPQIAIGPESHWIPRWFEKRKGLTPDGFVTPELISNLLDNRRFRRLRISPEQLDGLIKSDAPVSFATFVSDLFNLYGDRKRKPLVGDKTPGYARRIKTLHNLWPKARFIHLIRDGRNVCLSVVNWKRRIGDFTTRFPTWNEDPISTVALWWEWHVQMARDAGHLLGPELYYEIRYESLVTNPAEECERLCSFLGVSYDDCMLRFHEGRTKTDSGLSPKKAWIPIKPGLRDWRRQMAARDIEIFEAVVGHLLDELGYERAVPRLQSTSQKHAAGMRDLFMKGVRSGLNYQLPAHREGT